MSIFDDDFDIHMLQYWLISGWFDSPDSVNHAIASFQNDKRCKLYIPQDRTDGFFCLALFLEFGEEESFLKDVLCKLFDACGIINVAILNNREEDRHFSDIRLCFNKRIEDARDIDRVCASIIETISIETIYFGVSDNVFSERYLSPGIDVVSGREIDDDIVAYLHRHIQNSGPFFFAADSTLPSLQDISFHPFFHPAKSFPLPILLKSESMMPKNLRFLWGECSLDDVDPIIIEEISSYVVLGYYSRAEEFGAKGPHIVLCPELIEDAADNLNLDKKIVYLVVLIHELAHALMDKGQYLDSLPAHAMEESLANMITLQWFGKYSNAEFNEALKFMGKQPCIYRFGRNQYYANVDWRKWRDRSKNMHKPLKAWFDICFPGKKVVASLYNSVFTH